MSFDSSIVKSRAREGYNCGTVMFIEYETIHELLSIEKLKAEMKKEEQLFLLPTYTASGAWEQKKIDEFSIN